MATPPTGNPTGRPGIYTPYLRDKCLKLYRAGATDKVVALAIGVTEQTIDNWKIEHPDFFEALREAKYKADGAVRRAMYERAIGYEHADVHITTYEGEVIETPVTKKYPPDTKAGTLWLMNRGSLHPDTGEQEEWSLKQDITSKGNSLAPVQIVGDGETAAALKGIVDGADKRADDSAGATADDKRI